MSAIAVSYPPRFVRRTTLGENEYRVNFKQIDNDVIKVLISAEAREVTPMMSMIYLGLLASPQHCWERDGVIHFTGEDRKDGHLTAWEQMREITGVANSTLSKALDWMHKSGLIGYDARANGVGIRIFFNRASSSIRPKPGQKILRIFPTPTQHAPTPTDGMCFIGNGHEINRENKNIRAFARDEIPPVHSPHSSATAIAAAKPDAAFAVSLVKRIAEELRPEIREAIKRETDNTRAWFLNHGLPKATRVAQRETYDLLRAHGVIAKKSSNNGNVGRCDAGAEQGREGKSESDQLAAFLAETGKAIRQAAANSLASGCAILHATCQNADRQLCELQDHIAGGQSFDPQEIESRLAETEAGLAEALWKVTDKSELETMLKLAKTKLQDYSSRMETEVFEETLRRQVTTQLRKRHGIPRISLFYL